MCGFLGYVTNAEVRSETVNEAAKLMVNRGPDQSGFTVFQKFGCEALLIHKRLSIIDLTDSGKQPFQSKCGRYILLYNGEVYNYKQLREKLSNKGVSFQTETDTEVLLEFLLHSPISDLRNIVGMFAFALCDLQLGKITIARDAFGIKPLYYYIDDNVIVFGSDIKAICKTLPSVPVLDNAVSYHYLVHEQYDYSEHTFIKGIKQLNPGSYFEFKLKEFRATEIKRWWQPEISTNLDITFDDAAAHLRSLIFESMRLQLHADVPVAISLSGGLDSSILLSVARKILPEANIETFSYIEENKKYSEEYWVDYANAATEANSNKVVGRHLFQSSDIKRVINSQREPFGGGGIFAQNAVYKKARAKGIKVMLEGQGADELFAGYSGYPGQRLLSLLEKGQFYRAHKFARRWGQWPGRSYLLAWKYLMRLILPTFVYRILRFFMGRNFKPKWISQSVWSEEHFSANEFRVSLKKEFKGSRVKEAMLNSLCGAGLHSLLRHGDRNAMEHSIENRVPFLTLEIAEFVLSLPEHFLISDEGETKSILRRAMRGVVDDKILDRKDKLGFATDEEKHFKRVDESYFLKLLPSELPEFLNQSLIIAELNKYKMKGKKYKKVYWRWLNFIIWYRDICNEDSKSGP